MRKFTISIFVTFLSACAAFLASPFVTLLQIQSAINGRDGERLGAHINFPLLRSNLKEQLEGPAGAFIQKQGKSEIAGFFASLVGGLVVNSVVDKMVTPEGLSALLKGQTDLKKIEGGASASSESSSAGEKENAKKSFAFTSLTEFHLIITEENQAPVTIVLVREAFTWKMSNIILPIQK